MSPHEPAQPEANPRDPIIEDAFASFVRSAQAPPGFATRVRSRIARRRVYAERLRVAVPVLATCLVLSLSFNVWQGFYGESLPVERSIDPTRGVGVSTLQEALARGQRLSREHQYPAAVSAYQNALQEALRQLMVTSAMAYKDEQTIDAATALLLLTPNAAEPYRYRGLAYVRTGNKGQALQDIRRAADLGDPEAQRVLQTWERAAP